MKPLLIITLSHLLIAIPNPSEEMISKLKKMSYNFVWQLSVDKIKRDLCQDYKDGGLKMIQLKQYTGPSLKKGSAVAQW